MKSAGKYTSLDLFAGAGGFSLGLQADGYRLLGSIEIDPVASRTLRRNFGHQPLDFLGPKEGDVRKLDPKDVQKNLLESHVTELDVLVAGPPCQGFSRVGRAKLNSLKQKVGAFLYDPRNQLYKKAIDFVRVLRPRAVVLENVPGILTVRGNNFAELVCESLAECGYKVRCAVLNSAWYGVPQTRERIFVLGMRNDLGIEPAFPTRQYDLEKSLPLLQRTDSTNGEWLNSSFMLPYDSVPIKAKARAPITVGEAFADLPPFTAHIEAKRKKKTLRVSRSRFPATDYLSPLPPNDFCALMRTWGKISSEKVTDHFCRWTARDFETFRLMKTGDRYPQAHEIAKQLWLQARNRAVKRGDRPPSKAKFIPPYRLDSFEDKWRKLMPDRPSWTVTAHLSKDTYSHIHFDSKQARAISPREAARLQSFPDAFVFEGSMGDMFKQIGNAVPPLLARSIGEVIRKQLEAVDNRESTLLLPQPVRKKEEQISVRL